MAYVAENGVELTDKLLDAMAAEYERGGRSGGKLGPKKTGPATEEDATHPIKEFLESNSDASLGRVAKGYLDKNDLSAQPLEEAAVSRLRNMSDEDLGDLLRYSFHADNMRKLAAWLLSMFEQEEVQNEGPLGETDLQSPEMGS